jgi:hypothetical protein
MKQAHEEATQIDLGIRETPDHRDNIRKSLSLNDLQNEVGNASHHQTTALVEEQLPVSPSITAQPSTPHRHRKYLHETEAPLQSSQVAVAPRAHRPGSPTEIPVKNEFRAALDELCPIQEDADGKRAAVLPRLDLLTKSLFLEGKCLDLTTLSTELVPKRGQDAIDGTLYTVYLDLVERGRIQVAHNGLAGSGRTPFAFDLTRATPFAKCRATLGSVLQQFEATGPKTATRRAVLAAARVLLGMDPHSTRAEVLHKATDVSHLVFHRLVERFTLDAVQQGELSRKTIQNHAASLRKLLAFALRENLFPLFFPELRARDQWSSLVDRAFPLAATGKTSSTVRQARSGLTTLFAVARDELLVSSPSALTETDVFACLTVLSGADRMAERERVAGFKKVFGRAGGAWTDPVIALVKSALNRLRPKTGVRYLSIPGGGQRPVESLDGFLEVLQFHGNSAEWPEFFQWYAQYSMLTWNELLDRSDEFPVRPASRELSEDTFSQRFSAARAYLGAAKERFPDTYHLLRPTDVFGSLFSELTRDILASWRRSAEDGAVSHSASAGLHHLICAGGMIARALFDRAIHVRDTAEGNPRSEPEMTRASRDRERLNARATTSEAKVLHAYELSRSICDNLQADRKKSARGSGINTEKDLRQAIRETPFVNFQRAQEHLLGQVQTLISEGHALSRDGLCLTVATLITGLLVTGGCRRSELCHLREGLHTFLLENRRDVELRIVDRKNESPHDFVMRERWLPDWFLKHYLNVVHPHLLRKSGRAYLDRPFLVLSPHTGRPYGCAEEDALGGGRNARKFRERKKSFANLWRKVVATTFKSLKFKVPAGKQRFCMHVVRNVAGHAVFVAYGLEAAAHFLGDRVASVEGVYAALRGEYVDTSLLDASK